MPRKEIADSVEGVTTCAPQTELPFDDCPPKAEVLFESIRAFGYDIGMAVADLIDNSIAAGARRVWVIQKWSGRDSYVAVLDDGKGMDDAVLKNAMRLGSMSPSEQREPGDLGRFGLGLKTASLSQCRSLTVMSKPVRGDATVRCWDMDVVREKRSWYLLKSARPESLARLTPLEKVGSGTMVLWEKLDRVVGDSMPADEAMRSAYFGRIEYVREYLEMIYHRYIGTGGRLSISMGTPRDYDKPEMRLRPWDPFLRAHAATQELGKEAKELFGDRVVVKPYVLPHVSKLNPSQHENAAGPHGWNAQQGFYVYRKERLIVPGGWLNVGYKQEEHYKLARIQVDIPNNMDEEWKIDVKKSSATPPESLRPFLKRIAKITRDRAADVYRHRGRIAQRRATGLPVFVWRKTEKNGRVRYAIDRGHPVVEQLIDAFPQAKQSVTALIRLIEMTVPIEQIVITNNESPDAHIRKPAVAEESDFPVVEWFKSMVDLETKRGCTRDRALELVLQMEPFDQYPELAAMKDVSI
jgi:hypothetical protein